jgi:hypothetical protein
MRVSQLLPELGECSWGMPAHMLCSAPYQQLGPRDCGVPGQGACQGWKTLSSWLMVEVHAERLSGSPSFPSFLTGLAAAPQCQWWHRAGQVPQRRPILMQVLLPRSSWWHQTLDGRPSCQGQLTELPITCSSTIGHHPLSGSTPERSKLLHHHFDSPRPTETEAGTCPLDCDLPEAISTAPIHRPAPSVASYTSAYQCQSAKVQCPCADRLCWPGVAVLTHLFTSIRYRSASVIISAGCLLRHLPQAGPPNRY